LLDQVVVVWAYMVKEQAVLVERLFQTLLLAVVEDQVDQVHQLHL
jgi:hypothetical protein